MAYNFTAASSQYLSASTSTAQEPLTIAAWFYPTTIGVAQALGSIGINGGVGRCQLFVSIPNTLRLAHTDNSGGTAGATIDAAGSVVQDQWQHGCGVFASESSRTPYLNGVAGSENTVTIGTTGPFDSTLVGSRFNTTLGFYFSGRIAEFGVWNAALTADEVASLAKGMTCDKVRPNALVFYAPLIRNLQDVRGGLTITNNNGATVADHPRVYA
jgi:hypothetical protein